MKTDQKLNMTMLCDFYELTMGNGYLKAGFQDRITYFDVYFRSVPDGGGYAIAAGLDQLIDYIEDLHFDQQDIDYLRGRGIFCEEFLDYLASFHFSGDIYAVPEGTPVFPKEPMVVVRAPAIEAQLLETFALLTVNHQSLIATKANRIVRAAKGHAVMEFGFPPRAGLCRRHRRRSCCLYCGLLRHCLHHLRPALRHARARHDGPCLGADVRHGV